MDQQPPTPESFEQALDQLEEIIDQIEAGEVGLEQCLAYYERGVKLVNYCQSVLGNVEKRIAQLSEDADGRLSVGSDEDAPVIPEREAGSE